MKKKWLIWILIVVVLLIVGLIGFVEEVEEEVRCVPSSCCHSNSCVFESGAPNCSGRLCSMECVPGTMDCGQGHCDYVDGVCGVVWDE